MLPREPPRPTRFTGLLEHQQSLLRCLPGQMLFDLSQGIFHVASGRTTAGQRAQQQVAAGTRALWRTTAAALTVHTNYGSARDIDGRAQRTNAGDLGFARPENSSSACTGRPLHSLRSRLSKHHAGSGLVRPSRVRCLPLWALALPSRVSSRRWVARAAKRS